MTDNQFSVLEVLHDNKDKYLSENEICAILGDAIGRKDVLDILSQFDKREFLDPTADGNKISNIGINKYQSFLSLRQSLHQNQTLNKVNNTLAIIYKIGTIVFGISTIIFAYLNYSDRQEIKQKDQTISRQQTTIDSLRQLLDSQQKTIDSLQTILTMTDTTKK